MHQWELIYVLGELDRIVCFIMLYQGHLYTSREVSIIVEALFEVFKVGSLLMRDATQIQCLQVIRLSDIPCRICGAGIIARNLR